MARYQDFLDFPFEIGNSSRPLADSRACRLTAEGEQVRMSRLFAAPGALFLFGEERVARRIQALWHRKNRKSG